MDTGSFLRFTTVVSVVIVVVVAILVAVSYFVSLIPTLIHIHRLCISFLTKHIQLYYYIACDLCNVLLQYYTYTNADFCFSTFPILAHSSALSPFCRVNVYGYYVQQQKPPPFFYKQICWLALFYPTPCQTNAKFIHNKHSHTINESQEEMLLKLSGTFS